MEHDEVAIIGTASLLPGASNLTDLHERLREGYDGVGQPSAHRLNHSGGALETWYLPMGYLDRVDLFDHKFFGLSLREAELMDPHQRLVLQLAHEAVENAGYAPQQLRGSRTAVVLSEASSAYEDLFQDSDPQQILGSLPAATAARVSYLLDFVGPALVIDTACSSSLSAVAEAMRMLRDGDVDLALAGGVSVQAVLTPQRGHEPLRGVESPTGTCRPFDARADGIVGGEGGGIVVLKLLPTALADRDNVIGVLKGIAVNHNGYRAASMGAPSQIGQTEVIAQAWRHAGVEARSIRYVECHGSATPLGDVVEVDALRRAFLDAGVDTPHCTIGSVKGNIGHLGNAAGMAGLFKALCAVRQGMLYPAAHFETPNSLIDFSGPVGVNRTERGWPGSSTPRRAGVSSFGLTGTNVHAVLEQASAPDPSTVDEQESGVELVTVSAKSNAALARYCQRLADFVEHTAHNVRSVAHVMNRGRDDYPYRLAFVVETKRELAGALRTAVMPEHAVAQDARVVLLFSADAQVDGQSWSQLCGELPELATMADELGEIATSPQGLQVARQWALCRLISAWGLVDPHFVGNGTGNLVVRCARDELSARDAVRGADGATPSAELDRSRLWQIVQGFQRSGAVVVEMGADGMLSREIRRMAPERPTVALLNGTGRRDLLEQLGQIYRLGGTLDWERYYARAGITRIEVPTYPFEPVRCWVEPVGIGMALAETANKDTQPLRRTDPQPVADIERHIAAVWEDILKATDLHPESDYFALGGTSIAGISVLRRLERDFGVTLRFADLYAHRTVRSLAERVDQLRRPGREANHDQSITPIQRGGRLPLSFGQEQLWYLDRLNPGSALYNIPTDLRFRGPLDVAALRDALRDIAARHEVLRTCIRSDDGEPYVHVLPALSEPLLLDLSTLPPAERDRKARQLAEAEAVRLFDLAEGPLWRTTLLKLGDDDHVLLYTYHHIIFDGWSPFVFFRDFMELYRTRRSGQLPELPTLPIQYADFAAWQRSWLSRQRLETGLEFWRDQLAGLRPGELPLDRPRPALQSFVGDLVEFDIDTDLATRVRQFSRRHGVTTFVTMLAVVDALLHRWAHLDDVVVGVGTSGRVNPATHELIGYFNNLPPFRTRVSGDLAFTELVRRCADTVAGVLDHEEMPLEKIVSAVCGRRDPARHPLFDVAYTYQNAPAPTGDLAGLTITRYLERNLAGIAPGTAKFDLTFGVTDQDDGQMHAYIEYACALFDRETVRRLADWLLIILDAAMTNPRQRIDQLPTAPRQPTGQASVLIGNRPEPADGRLVWELVEEWATERPDHPAVVSDGCAYSYRDINRMANRLARRLMNAGVTTETTVPVVARRGVELTVAWLAVAKAGGACVPIDPGLPRQRIEQIVAETGTVVIGDVKGTLRIPIELTSTDKTDDENLSRGACPGNLAYVAYTSGSTGRPHGCQIEHRNLVDLVRWYREEVCLSTEDQTLQVASPGFDIAALEIWGSLCSGATIHFLPTALEEPGKLMRWLADRRITVAFLPTQLAEILLTDCAWPSELHLRVLSTGGDQLRIRPPAGCPFRLLNMYGPTECTVVSTAGEVGSDEDPLPDIGQPITGTAVYILDSRQRPVTAGELGEIFIGGGAVGRGYRRLASLTADRFVPDQFSDEPGARMYRTGDLGRLRLDGTIEFSGRIDDQVEVRGRRVEPAEVERVLVDHPSVHEALVVAATAPSGSTRLIANVTTVLPPPAEHDLIAWAARALPSYMVPSQVVVRERLPRTTTGKLDRKGMRELTMSTTTLETSTNGQRADEAVQVLVRICADLLSVGRVGPEDNFFELGGDSVLGVRLAARAAKEGVFFTPQQLLQHHTLRALAEATHVTGASRTDESSAPAAATVPARTVVPSEPPIHLTPIMHGFLDRMPHSAQDFLTVHPLETTTRIESDTMRAAVEHVLARHEPLRYRFRRNSLSWRIDCAAPGAVDVFDVKILPPVCEQDEMAVLAADLEELRSRINLERGPALRVRYYDRGHNRNGWIVFVIHHFVFDNMSIVVLIDDLDEALADLTTGRSLSMPRPSSAWRQWAQHLQDMAVSDELAGELTYWTGILRTGAATLAHNEGSMRVGAPGVIIRNIDPDRVAEALKGGPHTDETAMGAFACAVARWHGTTSAYLMTEGAAAPNAYRLAGRPPAVGWFTTVHPLMLPVDPGMSVLDCLPAITDRVRSVPHDGVGYGILRHLTPDSPALARLRSLAEPEVLVIHSSHGGDSFDSGVRLLRNRLDLLAAVPKRSTDCFPLALSTAVIGGSLQLVVNHDGRYGAEEVESLADEVVRAFTELVN